MTMNANDIYDRITAGASKHAAESDEPDHEVGDLQDALRIALEHMDRAQLRAMAEHSGILGIMSGVGPDGGE